MTRDRDKDSTLGGLQRPEKRLGLLVFDSRRHQTDSRGITNKLPVAFIVQVQALEVASDWMFGASLEIEFERPVPIARLLCIPGQSNSLGKARCVGAAVHRIVH